MPRVCEICGRSEADVDAEAEVTNAIEMLFVCDRCREDRPPQADRSL